MTVGSRSNRKNQKLIDARLRRATADGTPWTPQDVADEMNAFLWAQYQKECRKAKRPRKPTILDHRFVSGYESGRHRWPTAQYRAAFRHALRVETDAELGFTSTRRPRRTPSVHIPDTAAAARHDVAWPQHRPVSQHVVRVPLLPSLMSSTALNLHGAGSPPAAPNTLRSAGGRFFQGESVDTRTYPAVDDGRILAAVPADFAASRFLTRARRGLVVGAIADDGGATGYGLDTRQARRRLAKAGPGSRLLIPPAYVLDDVTVGILWAVVNLDEPLLNDDSLLHDLQQELLPYESMPNSSLGRDLASELTAVSQMWIGSYFCAHHILRHLDGLADIPEFWTREQRGEEASTWLLFRHKYDYLRAIAERFAGGQMTRAFCVPPDAVAASPHGERILLLLSAALMESFGIQVNVSTEAEYAAVEGFVLDRDRAAIVANWFGADGIWRVGVTTDRPSVRDYGEIAAHTGAHSAITGPSAGRRLRMLADYLELDWVWLVARCRQLGEHGCSGFAAPRSRLLSIAGVDRACQYVGEVGMISR